MTGSETHKPRVLGVIPARIGSTRLPRKVLRGLAGRRLLEWVYEAAAQCTMLNDLCVATDSDEVQELCQQRGWTCLMTDPSLPSGTDRLHAVSLKVAADIYVNIQADEPLLQPQHIADLLRPFAAPHVDVATLKVSCPADAISNPNVVKVVCAADGRALYFSRTAIPFDRDATGAATYWKHLGLYAYRREALARFAALPPGVLEQTERLEQLRLLEHGMALYVGETASDTIGVDTEDDLRRVEAILLREQTKL